MEAGDSDLTYSIHGQLYVVQTMEMNKIDI